MGADDRAAGDFEGSIHIEAAPPASSTLEVTLVPEGQGTRVRVIHRGLPPSERARHAMGWRHYLPRLETAATGGDVAPHHVPADLTRGAD